MVIYPDQEDLIETRPHFIGKNEFPFVGTIRSTEKIKGKFGTDVRLTLRSEAGEDRVFDLWGGNLNFMVSSKGNNLNNWCGVRVHINRNSDLKRVLSLVMD